MIWIGPMVALFMAVLFTLAAPLFFGWSRMSEVKLAALVIAVMIAWRVGGSALVSYVESAGRARAEAAIASLRR